MFRNAIAEELFLIFRRKNLLQFEKTENKKRFYAAI